MATFHLATLHPARPHTDRVMSLITALIKMGSRVNLQAREHQTVIKANCQLVIILLPQEEYGSVFDTPTSLFVLFFLTLAISHFWVLVIEEMGCAV